MSEMPHARGQRHGQNILPAVRWNRAEADKHTRLFLRVLPILVMVFDAPLILWIFLGHAEISVLAVLGFVAIVPAILVVLIMKGKIRMEVFGDNPRSLP